jgi:hypothetical protein
MSPPSRLRREGRNAFYRGGDPSTLCRYKPGTSDFLSWMEGWDQALRDDQDAIVREADAEAEEEAKIEEFARLYNLCKDRGLIS